MGAILNPARHGGGPSSVLLNNLVSWWNLGETSGVRYDSHGSHHLRDVNSVGWAAGANGNAALFRGDSNRLDNLDYVWSPADKRFEMGCWEYVPSFYSLESHFGAMGNDGWGYFSTSNNQYMRYKNGSYENTDSTEIEQPTGTWYLTTIRGIGSRAVQISHNGAYVYEQSIYAWDTTVDRILYFGNNPYRTWYPPTNMRLQSGFYYDDYITTEQMTLLLNNGTPLLYGDFA